MMAKLTRESFALSFSNARLNLYILSAFTLLLVQSLPGIESLPSSSENLTPEMLSDLRFQLRKDRLNDRCGTYLITFNKDSPINGLQKDLASVDQNWGQIFVEVMKNTDLVNELSLIRDLQDCVDYWKAGAGLDLGESIEKRKNFEEISRLKMFIDDLLTNNDEKSDKIDQLNQKLSDKDDELSIKSLQQDLEIKILKNDQLIELKKLESNISDLTDKKMLADNEKRNYIEQIATLKEELEDTRQQLKENCSKQGQTIKSMSQQDELKNLEYEKSVWKMKANKETILNLSLNERLAKVNSELENYRHEHNRLLNDQMKLFDLSNGCMAQLRHITQLQETTDKKLRECEKISADFDGKLMKVDHNVKDRASIDLEGAYKITLDDLLILVDQSEQLMTKENLYFDQWRRLVMRYKDLIENLSKKNKYKIAKKYIRTNEELTEKLELADKMIKKMSKIINFEDTELRSFLDMSKSKVEEWIKKVRKLDKLAKKCSHTPFNVKNFVATRYAIMADLDKKHRP